MSRPRRDCGVASAARRVPGPGLIARGAKSARAGYPPRRGRSGGARGLRGDCRWGLRLWGACCIDRLAGHDARAVSSLGYRSLSSGRCIVLAPMRDGRCRREPRDSAEPAAAMRMTRAAPRPAPVTITVLTGTARTPRPRQPRVARLPPLRERSRLAGIRPGAISAPAYDHRTGCPPDLDRDTGPRSRSRH